VQISDPKISERHLSIKYIGNYDYEVKDLNSSTGELKKIYIKNI
jgi:FHA domain.